MSAANIVLRAALWYALHLHWRVFPTHGIEFHDDVAWCTCGRKAGKKEDGDCQNAGKHPRTRHGCLDATTDPKVIEAWWHRWPDANVGIATGRGLLVLDVDPRHDGDDSTADLERTQGKLPDTVEDLTGGGGRHVYLIAPPGVELKNSAGQLGRGLDIRTDGGYVIAPPSLHESGRRYEWEGSSRPDEVALAPAPEWLIDLLRVQRVDGRPAAKPLTEWQRLITTVAPEGERNGRLATIAGYLFRHHIEPHGVLVFVEGWNATLCKPPLPDGEVETIVKSIAARELKRRGVSHG